MQVQFYEYTDVQIATQQLLASSDTKGQICRIQCGKNIKIIIQLVIFFRHFFDIESYLIFSYKLNAIPAPARTTQSSFRKVWNQPNPLKVFLCLGGWPVAAGCAAGQGSVQQILTQDPSFIVLNNSEGVNISSYSQFQFADISTDFI